MDSNFKRSINIGVLLFLSITILILVIPRETMASTEQDKQLAINKGLVWLATTQVPSGAEGYWPYPNNGTVAATASAALAFIEEGFLPGDDVIIDIGSGPVNHGDVVGRAVLYVFNRALLDSRFGVEPAGYGHLIERYAEDYNNDGDFTNDGGNDEAMYFDPTNYSSSVYTTGIVAPVIFALGEALGNDAVINFGSSAISGKTYAQALQDVIDWFSWGQVEPNLGSQRGGWRYYPNFYSSDNSTAQWGSLPMLYARAWGLQYPQYVVTELELWVNYIQDPSSGGSGYSYPTQMVNVSKTAGLLLELAVIGADVNDSRVQLALGFINTRWNTGPSSWYGNLNHPYAMWAVYKALEVYGFTAYFGSGPDENFIIGSDIPNAPGGFVIGQEWWDDPPVTSLAGDWYSHYCDFLVNLQLGNGSWQGYSSWYGALAAGWYINILNAAGAPPPQTIEVFVDVKPQSCPNPVNPKAKGVFPAAILGTEEFDVTTMDPATVVLDRILDDDLDGVSPLRWELEDVAAPYFDNECGCWMEGPDGFMDLTLKFDYKQMVTTLGEVENGEEFALILTGQLLEEFGSTDIEGYDCVIIRFKEKSDKIIAAESDISLLPQEFALDRLYPNPFNPSTMIRYALPEDSEVKLVIYNTLGQAVATLVNQFQGAGYHSIQWQPRGLSSGLYIVSFNAGNYYKIEKIIYMK